MAAGALSEWSPQARESETPWTSKISFAERPEFYKSLEEEFRASWSRMAFIGSHMQTQEKAIHNAKQKGGDQERLRLDAEVTRRCLSSHVTCESRAELWQNFPLRTPQAPQVSTFADESLLTPLSSKKLTIPLQQVPTIYRTGGQGWA
jgi:hypothetical protein